MRAKRTGLPTLRRADRGDRPASVEQARADRGLAAWHRCFQALPSSFLAVLVGMIAIYLALAQFGVALFFTPQGGRSLARAISRRERRIARRAARWVLWRPGAAPPTAPTPQG